MSKQDGSDRDGWLDSTGSLQDGAGGHGLLLRGLDFSGSGSGDALSLSTQAEPRTSLFIAPDKVQV